jgi:hypothetical protein
MVTPRKPMTFDIDVEPTKAEAVNEEVRKAIGARIPVGLYRQAKAHAALTGIKVQDLVEIALRDYLSNIKEPV